MIYRYVSLVVFLVVVVGGGSLIGVLTAPGEWYAELQKASFNPPPWVFPPVWGTLYVMIAIAGWRVWWIVPPGRPRALWVIQMALNFAWSPVFFSARMPALALLVVLVMLAAIVAFIVSAWRVDRVAAWLFVPYAAWVAFATLLNASIVWLN